jgi:hypothetical protein
MPNNYTFSHPASPDVNGTSSWHQQLAGSGRHGEWSERQRRGMEMRARTSTYALPVMPDPLHSNEAQAFADEWAEDNAPHRSVAKDMIVGGVLSAGLLIAVRARRNRNR